MLMVADLFRIVERPDSGSARVAAPLRPIETCRMRRSEPASVRTTCNRLTHTEGTQQNAAVVVKPDLCRWYRATVVNGKRLAALLRRFAALLRLHVGVAQAHGHSSKPKPDGFLFMLLGQQRARTYYTTDVGIVLSNCRISSTVVLTVLRRRDEDHHEFMTMTIDVSSFL